MFDIADLEVSIQSNIVNCKFTHIFSNQYRSLLSSMEFQLTGIKYWLKKEDCNTQLDIRDKTKQEMPNLHKQQLTREQKNVFQELISLSDFVSSC